MKMFGLAASRQDLRHSFPFKGKVGMGMGFVGVSVLRLKPIPTLALPLKGRELQGIVGLVTNL